MTTERKKYIDNLWMNTDYGKWIFAATSKQETEAKNLIKKMCSTFPFHVDQIDQNLSKKIANEIKSMDEWNEYLKLLDEENANLMDFIISCGIFETVDNILLSKSNL